MKRDSEARKGKKYDESEVPLSNEQDEEMNQVMAMIERECSDELGKLFHEGDKQGLGDSMRYFGRLINKLLLNSSRGIRLLTVNGIDLLCSLYCCVQQVLGKEVIVGMSLQ